MLKLLEWTLVNRAYQLTRTLLFPAWAETVESTSSTVEDGGRERFCGLDVNQSLSQPTKYIHSRRRVELNHVEKQTNSFVTSCTSAPNEHFHHFLGNRILRYFSLGSWVSKTGCAPYLREAYCATQNNKGKKSKQLSHPTPYPLLYCK